MKRIQWQNRSFNFVDGGLSIDEESWRQSSEFINQRVIKSFDTSIEENPEQHFAEIAHTIALAQENDIDTNIYLEDWSNGMRNSLSMCFNF
jgi:D-citramalate synthase